MWSEAEALSEYGVVPEKINSMCAKGSQLEFHIGRLDWAAAGDWTGQ
jgi:hypothetical protein